MYDTLSVFSFVCSVRLFRMLRLSNSFECFIIGDAFGFLVHVNGLFDVESCAVME